MIRICRRIDTCLIGNNKSCAEEEALKCGQFIDLEKKLQEFQKKVAEELKRKGHFAYSESWYFAARKQLINGKSIAISEKKFMLIEDKIVLSYLKNK